MEIFKRISVEQAREIMQAGKATIVDIRDPGSFAEGHVPQAKSVNDENIDSFLKETDREIPLICYCYHGISSQRAADYFVTQGFKEVYSIDGGFEEWKKTNV